MPMRMALRYLAGYVEAVCRGGFAERFLSACMAAGLDLFDVRPGADGVRFCVRARDYAAAARAAKKCQCRVRIERKRGLRFPLHGVRQRGPLAAGLAVFAAVLIFLGGCVVTVDIRGSSLVSRSELRAALGRYGLRAGMARGDVRVDYVEQNVLMELPQLAWIAVNLSYGKATVEVTDKQTKPGTQTGDPGCMIVASRDAQIRRVDLVSGVAQVRPGDVVRAGQPLVLPQPQALPGSWARAANARILAYTTYGQSFTVGGVYVCDVPTGERESRRALLLLGGCLPLGRAGSSFGRFETQSYTRPLVLFGVELPAAVRTLEYTRLETRSYALDARRALLLLHEWRDAYERETLAGRRILSREEDFGPFGDGWRCTVSYLCEECIEKYIQIE